MFYQGHPRGDVYRTLTMKNEQVVERKENAGEKLATEMQDWIMYQLCENLSPAEALQKLTELIERLLAHYKNWTKIMRGKTRDDEYTLAPKSVDGCLGYWFALNDEVHGENHEGRANNLLELLELLLTGDLGVRASEEWKARNQVMVETMMQCMKCITTDPANVKDLWLRFVSVTGNRLSDYLKTCMERIIKVLGTQKALVLAGYLFDKNAKIATEHRDPMVRYLWRAISNKDYISGRQSTGHNHFDRIQILYHLIKVSETFAHRDGLLKTDEMAKAYVTACTETSKSLIQFGSVINSLAATVIEKLREFLSHDYPVFMFEFVGLEYDLSKSVLYAMKFKLKYESLCRLQYKLVDEQREIVSNAYHALVPIIHSILGEKGFVPEHINIKVDVEFIDPPKPDPQQTPGLPIKETWGSKLA